MCGIFGCLIDDPAGPVVVEGLRRLEYRGYDSAGLAVVNDDGEVQVRKVAGRVNDLAHLVQEEPVAGHTGIGHTRWATHGEPSWANAHPQLDCSGRIVVVHNGIIDNEAKLRKDLVTGGHRFRSETDSEVIAHLIEAAYRGDLPAAVAQAMKAITGSYAVAVVHAQHPGEIVAARRGSPLVVGKEADATFVASDIPALLNWTRSVLVLENGELAALSRRQVRLFDADGHAVNRDATQVTWQSHDVEKDGYAHFMLKEIHEQPDAVRNTLGGHLRIDDGELQVSLPDACRDVVAQDFSKVYLLGMGSARHAALVGKYVLEPLLHLPVEVDHASEFRYRSPMVHDRTLAVVVSQSGETADTLAALQEARGRGATILGITNVVGSSLARAADYVFYTEAGPEVAVASTKAYMAQLVALYLLGLGFGARSDVSGGIQNHIDAIAKSLLALPDKMSDLLGQISTVRDIAAYLQRADLLFVIGRGLDYPVAEEGALKLKEVSYIPAQAMTAGELKHGTLALIEPGTPVLALVTQSLVAAKTWVNVREAQSRGARVIAVTYEDEPIPEGIEAVLPIPRINDTVSPCLAVVPLQLLAYQLGIARGCDVDRPRNLAKSVTVE